MTFSKLSATLQTHQLGQRLDQALAEIFPDYSRSRIKDWIVEGKATLNGVVVTTPKEKVFGYESVTLTVELIEQVNWHAESMALDIYYEDEDILVINKPAGLVVHPGAGIREGTLLNGLLGYYPAIAEVARAGIVHRLDKDTTGLMVVAKTVPAQTHLVEALQARRITREYEAVAIGYMTAGGRIDQPIARHPTKRTHMAVHPMGKPAATQYRLIKQYRAHTHLRLRLESGRTHQIRVHMAHLNHPLVGDPLYGGRSRLPAHSSDNLIATLQAFNRQALHAAHLALNHPITQEPLAWSAPLPDDFQNLLKALQVDLEENIDRMY
ncbi:23S rRNA pseudouridine(1911/1915/1917) synthase RluD [Thorsellia anophelis]|uniref:Pseudouridine synthase n=1 Tax=Thorsellia anophelis DSM 18579 TaxID=1123402 RepID=A0A1H9YWH1_9GAMM|nr:23S rRNA pseudouridine(1911/1915/1917) synthase RluD [Thorsellia anophelis]SES73590.1 23S rRNA pseudouridine1911/1915/1917 synthase [Thorsellia anophelis DSM 18579]